MRPNLSTDSVFVHAGSEQALVIIGESEGNAVGKIDTIVDDKIRGRNQEDGDDGTHYAVERIDHCFAGQDRRAGGNDSANLSKNGSRQQKQNRDWDE